MFDIGASLAAARETAGLSLADAERLTCVRSRFLAALEASDFDALPGRAYARAFLRTYATALGLEADRYVAAFEELVPEPPDEAIAVGTPPPRRLRSAHVAAGVVAAAAVAVVALAATSRTAHTVPPAATPTTPRHVLAARHVVRHSRPQALVVRAARADCWILARRGGPAGPVLYEGTLRAGSTLRFAAPRVWLRLGAPAAVDVVRGSRTTRGLDGAAPLNITA